MDIVRLAVFAIWGGGTVLVYGRVLAKRVRSWRRHRDSRSGRDLITGIALFLTALGSALSIVFVLFGAAGTGMRGFFVALSLGMFLAAGFVMAGEDEAQEAAEPTIYGGDTPYPGEGDH